ncbi:uncharacterized protein LOC125677208 isoform X2 [Ostrea edulis]|uniref:uncharacterized protein LOC125677208 isoform X2 n=1 Tax=Ostrea edulis TaxID=37623 RepID=UPI0024AFDAF6|nr:uncharacterized protein LOC125677208 isoform X2 [Ostrea edulis]
MGFPCVKEATKDAVLDIFGMTLFVQNAWTDTLEETAVTLVHIPHMERNANRHAIVTLPFVSLQQVAAPNLSKFWIYLSTTLPLTGRHAALFTVCAHASEDRKEETRYFLYRPSKSIKFYVKTRIFDFR